MLRMSFLLVAAAFVFSAPSCQAQLHLRRGESQSNNHRKLPVASTEGTTEWSQEFAKRLAVGFNMTLIVKDDYLTKEKISDYHNNVFQSFQVFQDILDDKSVIAKVDNVCYLAIRGQERHIIMDIWQTLSPFIQRNVFDSGCDVKRSFYRAYNARFAPRMLQALDDCAASCEGENNEPCPVVLHGHSTGASAISIAALDPRIKKHNPTIFSMAPLRGIVSADCPDQELNDIYRIVLAYSGAYDGASTGRLHQGYHYGKFFIIDETSNPYFIAIEDNFDRSPEDMALHGLEVYHQRMNALASRPASEFPLKLTKFPNGHWCNYEDECESTFCNSNTKVCEATGDDLADVLRTVGSSCESGEQCDSGVCKYNTCALPGGIMGEGSPCQQHLDCGETQYCALTDDIGQICLSLLYAASFCELDEECASGSCSGAFSLLARKQRCADP